MKKRIGIWMTVLIAALLLTGCGDDVISLSDYEYDGFVNYASGLLVRYGKGSQDKLTFLDTSYTPEYLLAESMTQQQITPVTEPEPEPEPAPEPEPEPEPEKEPEDEEGPEEVRGEETEDENHTEEQEDIPSDEERGGAEAYVEPQNLTAIDASRLQSLAGGITAEYTGYSVRNNYPDSVSQGAVSAAYGDKLLIVDFRLRNTSGNAVDINTAFMGPQYKLLINNDVQGFTMVTMIENDLSSLLTTIPAGGYLDTVLLMEVPEELAKNVDTLSLIIQYGADVQTIRLE